MKLSYRWLLLLTSLTACQTLVVEPENTPESNFEFAWKTLNNKFSLFEINQVKDWQEIYSIYRPQVNNNISDDSLHAVLNRMVLELKDRHSFIRSNFEYKQSFNIKSNIDQPTVINHYLKNAQKEGGIQYTILEDNIAYAYVERFGRTISTENVIAFIESIEDTEGLILDIRGNGGGNENNALRLAEALYDERRLHKTVFSKNGPGKNDFIERFKAYVSPWDRPTYTKAIALLIDRNTYSASSDMVLMLRVLPHVTLIGNTSGGGHGTPVREQMPNGWVLQFSSSYALDHEGVQVEHGIPPTIHVDLDLTKIDEGIDTVIERAKEHIKG